MISLKKNVTKSFPKSFPVNWLDIPLRKRKSEFSGTNRQKYWWSEWHGGVDKDQKLELNKIDEQKNKMLGIK